MRRQERREAATPAVCGCRIALTDVARALVEGGVLGSFSAGRVTTTAAAMGLDTAPDWAGRPSVTADDAGALRVELLRRRDADRAAQAEEARARDEAMRASREKLLGGVQVNGKPV
ncbi:hypothetical protein AB0I85_28530 [Micromonospora echinofusca]